MTDPIHTDEPYEESASTLKLVQQLVAAYMHLSVASRVARDVSVNEDLVLMHLSGGPATNADLCRRIGITSASMSHILAGLEARGLLRRLPDEADGRRVLIYATKAAITSLDDDDLAQPLDAIFDEMDTQDRLAVSTFLARVATMSIP